MATKKAVLAVATDEGRTPNNEQRNRNKTESEGVRFFVDSRLRSKKRERIESSSLVRGTRNGPGWAIKTSEPPLL